MVFRGNLLLVALAAGCAAGQPGVVDVTADFLARACPAAAGEPFARAWLEHERRNWRVYGPLYYPEGEPGRAAAARERGARRDDLCKQTRAFAVAAPALLQALRPRVARLIGARPRARAILSAPVIGSDGRTLLLDGEVVLALNATAETYARLNGTVVTLTHELVHDAQKARWAAELARLPPLAASLYSEGGAVFAMTLLYPETGDRATGLAPEKLAAVDRAAAAADLLAEIDGADAPPRFFGGGDKVGYVLGLAVLRELARRIGDLPALQLSPAEFLRQARPILARMATARTASPAPRAR